MKILLATSELHPFSKTGGLADMVGALSKFLATTGHPFPDRSILQNLERLSSEP